MLCAAEVPGESCAAADPRLSTPTAPGTFALGEPIMAGGAPAGGVRAAVGEGNKDGSIADVSGLRTLSAALPLLRAWPGMLRITEKPSASALTFGKELRRYGPAGDVCIGGSWDPEETFA